MNTILNPHYKTDKSSTRSTIPVEQIFENVAKLAQEIEAINTDIHHHFQQIKLSELNNLLLLNLTVIFAFDYLKQHYQQAIFTQ